MQQLQELFCQWCGAPAASTDRLPGAGSNRQYYRLTASNGHSVIGCVGTNREENHAFIELARHFHGQGLPVPQVLAVSADEMRYLQQDLGGTSLFDALRSGREAGGRYSDDERQLLRQTISLLPRVQFEGARGLDFSVCYPQPAFDETGIMFDLNYFKYCFLKPSGTEFHELRLEHDFRHLAADLVASCPEDVPCFLYRDFQARNIMLCQPQQTPFLIDFQGGRRGPFYYDLASFLWQASARYPQTLRQELIDVYYAQAQHYVALPPRQQFDRTLCLFVLFRLMQVLGAYGFRGYFERKQHFINSIPLALDSLHLLLADNSFDYPCLLDVLQRLTHRQLVVSIYSFSYKKGIPQDESGNGGGYVFDCRGPHNPGRYERYKQLTGLDQPVIDFLEQDGEITTFLQSVYGLADVHVARYVERGFTSLMFCFGCTGGQHRSVYSAQHLAEHIHSKFPMVQVRLCHREQGISVTMEPAG